MNTYTLVPKVSYLMQNPYSSNYRDTMIDLDDKQLNIVKHILKTHIPDYEVRAYGSRVTGNADKFSDLDIAILSLKNIDWRRLEHLKDSFSASELSIIVHIASWQRIADHFCAIKQGHYVVLQQANRHAASIYPT